MYGVDLTISWSDYQVYVVNVRWVIKSSMIEFSYDLKATYLYNIYITQFYSSKILSTPVFIISLVKVQSIVLLQDQL